MATIDRLMLAGWMAVALLLTPNPAPAQPAPAAPTNDDCLGCHADPSMVRANGEPVVVPPDRFAASVHAPLGCVDCHSDLARGVEFPHAEKLAKVNCASCHDAAAQDYQHGVHAQARRANHNNRAANCLDCHGGDAHAIRPSTDPQSATHKLNIALTCAKCHGNKAPVRLSGGRSGAVAGVFHDSIHGQALEKKGLIVAPTCSDCHGNHAILAKRMTDSPVFPKNVPATCGKCHEGIRQEYAAGVHGAKLAGGNLSAPTCASCHTAHGIERTDTDRWQLHAIEQCGTCHKESLATYRDTFHGQVTALGFTPVAKCVDCHGPHRIYPENDPRSTVHAANLVETCGTCHAGANANFVKYNPHANKHDRSRLPALYYSARFMDSLLLFVFAFFGIHTMLWFSRGRVKIPPHLKARAAMKALPRPPAPGDGPEGASRGGAAGQEGSRG